MSIKGKHRIVPISDLRPNSWNPNAQSDFMFDREKESISRFGFVDPVTARQVDGKLEIIDGEHRWRAAKETGLKKIAVIDLGELPDEEAKALTLLLNELRGKADHQGLAEIVVELIDTDSGYEDVLPYIEEEVHAFRECLDFDWSTISGNAPIGQYDGRSPLIIRLLTEEKDTVDKALDVAQKKHGLSKPQALTHICQTFLKPV